MYGDLSSSPKVSAIFLSGECSPIEKEFHSAVAKLTNKALLEFSESAADAAERADDAS